MVEVTGRITLNLILITLHCLAFALLCCALHRIISSDGYVASRHCVALRSYVTTVHQML